MNWLELFTATDHFLLTLAQQYGAWIYATLFAIFFCETGVVFLAFLPGDSLLFVAGAVAAGGAMDVTTVMATVLAGAIAGNSVNYFLGAWFGRRIYDGTIGWIDQAYLRKTHDFYHRHGGKTVVLARFIPVVRTFAPLVAGAGGMDLRRFMVYSAGGALVWVVSLVGGGYLFGALPLVRDNLGNLTIEDGVAEDDARPDDLIPWEQVKVDARRLAGG